MIFYTRGKVLNIYLKLKNGVLLGSVNNKDAINKILSDDVDVYITLSNKSRHFTIYTKKPILNWVEMNRTTQLGRIYIAKTINQGLALNIVTEDYDLCMDMEYIVDELSKLNILVSKVKK